MMLHILVVDDNADLVDAMRTNVEKAVGGRGNVTTLTGKDLIKAIRELRQREANWRVEGRWSPRQYNAPFDSADILVLDYRLADLYGTDGYMTGEDLAALARRYSTAGPILSVNRFGKQSFDLRLRPETQTWAEVSIAHEDLRNRRLWSAGAEGSYRPWGWPSLEHLPELFDRRVRHALRHFDSSVAESLGILQTQLDLMPRKISESLGDDPFGITFRDVALQRAFPSDNVPKPSRPQMARVAAAEVGKWLSHSVLPGQDILIDAPHLVVQYPSLVKGRPTQTRLNQLARLSPGADLPLDATRIKGAQLRPGFWLDRPAWWAEAVLENRELLENRRPWERTPLDYRFAEDTSAFHTPTECQAFQAVGMFGERYVCEPDETIAYTPASRLLR